MIFSLIKKFRRQRLINKSIPNDWEGYLNKNIWYYNLLPNDFKNKLKNIIKIFINEKSWQGCENLYISPEIKVTISAQACYLLLGFNDYYFDTLNSRA